MCLRINECYHSTVKDKAIPIVADKDYMVYKALLPYKKDYYTPYQDMLIPFNEEGCADLKKVNFGFSDRYFGVKVCYGKYTYIENGYHSFIAKEDIEFKKKCIFPAIIPKGTKMFLGHCNDVVAQKLIIFKDVDSLKEKFADFSLLSRCYHKFKV